MTGNGGPARTYEPELVALGELRPHPRNYRDHPADQVEHLSESIGEHGFYRNVVAARDGTILAGHGVVEAARARGETRVPVIRLDIDSDDPKALKILTGDNEIARIAEVDDRLLSELLREINAAAELLGTGYDEQMLAALVFVTRNEQEIPTADHAADWAAAGMPSFEEFATPYKTVVSFDTAEDRERFLALIEVTVINRKDRETWSVRWPPREKEDLSSLFFAPSAAES